MIAAIDVLEERFLLPSRRDFKSNCPNIGQKLKHVLGQIIKTGTYMKRLSSKKYSSGNFDYWWYNLSNVESWMTPNEQITFILNEKDNSGRVGSIILNLKTNSWYEKIIQATSQIYKGRKLIKVHVTKKPREPYRIYFGHVDDGVYSATLKP